jgi:phenylpropionate dioxygenase-like ring-hydroxylating dioxygenase large terminal subunit
MTQTLDGRRSGTEDVGRSSAHAFAHAAPSSLPDLERELATVRLPLEEATTLPGRLYHDPEIHRRELRDIFSTMWLCVGREEDVERPGDFLTRTVGPESVIVVRDADGRIHAFHNVCRHRGSRLVTESSGAGLKSFLCPYHAWTYGLDGALRVAPHMDDARGFDRTQYGLNRVRLERWDGFLFINFSGEGPSLMEHLGEMDTKFARYRMGDLRRGKRIAYTVDTNWKMLCENYSECYHCALIHPELNKVSYYTSGEIDLINPATVGGWMELRKEEYETMSLSGKSNRPPLRGLPPEDLRRIHYYILYPNMLLSLHPDYVMTHVIWPQDVGRCEVICEFLFDADEVRRENFDPSDAADFWDLTNRQDWRACELTYQGTLSGGYTKGRLSTLEWMVHIFDNFVADRLLGKTEHTLITRTGKEAR